MNKHRFEYHIGYSQFHRGLFALSDGYLSIIFLSRSDDMKNRWSGTRSLLNNPSTRATIIVARAVFIKYDNQTFWDTVERNSKSAVESKNLAIRTVNVFDVLGKGYPLRVSPLRDAETVLSRKRVSRLFLSRTFEQYLPSNVMLSVDRSLSRKPCSFVLKKHQV